METEQTGTRTRKKAAVVEEKKPPVCRGHNQLHMCFNCIDVECKTKGFFKMHRCKNLFYWVLSMASLLIMFVGLIALYIIIRINDNNWSDWVLPLSFLTAFIAFALIILVIVSTIDFKHRTGDAIYEEQK